MRAVLASLGVLVSSFAMVAATAQAPGEDVRAFVLTVDRQGSFFVTAAGAPLPLDDASIVEQATAALRRNAGTALIVEADEGAPDDRVRRAALLLQEAGATGIRFRTLSANER